MARPPPSDIGVPSVLTPVVLTAFATLILPLAICLGLTRSLKSESMARQSLREPLVEARGHSGYILLTLGFFVCGFQVQFIASHLTAFVAVDQFSLSHVGTIGSRPRDITGAQCSAHFSLGMTAAGRGNDYSA